MPKATKDTEKDKLNKSKSTTSKATKVSEKKTTTKRAASTTKKAASPTKKTATKKSTSAEKKKTTTSAKKSSSETKKKSTSTTKTATSTAKKTTAKKSTTTTKKKTTSSAKKTTTTKKKVATKKLETNIVAEYYDLPYRYNETLVKILYQTPTILFVYWDISDFDRENFIKQYGQNFFNNTKPVLKIYNLTKNYDFEVEINDFANSWYINVNDADCEYKVELIRRTIRFEESLNTDYIYISTSNNIEFPNDRILLDQLPDKINLKNVKTNEISTKDISTMRLIGINKIYKVHDFYKKFYKDEILEEFDRKTLINPSSSSWN